MFKLLIVCLLFSSVAASGEEFEIMGGKYISGLELFNEFKSSSLAQLIGPGTSGFVDVPLDYAHPDKTLKLYYRLPRTFDKSKPTVLFFEGGPGSNSAPDFEITMSNFNWIFFDQRGTGFSHPSNLEQLKDAENFSSENSAKDAKTLIDFLEVRQVSVYGGSYGTVVATIFAHLYPKATKSVVLEGVVYDGTAWNYWVKPTRVEILKNFFANLPEVMRSRIVRVSKYGTLPPTWFSNLATKFMTKGNFAIHFREKLNTILSGDDQALVKSVSDDLDSNLARDSWHFSGYTFYHIACRELSRGEPFGSGYLIFNDQSELVPDKKGDETKCKEANRETPQSTYYAVQFPLTMNVTYIQGREDGRTDMTNAIKHYTEVAKGHAQLILVSNGGHGPLAECLDVIQEDSECKHLKKRQELFSSALLGKKLDEKSVRAIGPTWQLVYQK